MAYFVTSSQPVSKFHLQAGTDYSAYLAFETDT